MSAFLLNLKSLETMGDSEVSKRLNWGIFRLHRRMIGTESPLPDVREGREQETVVVMILPASPVARSHARLQPCRSHLRATGSCFPRRITGWPDSGRSFHSTPRRSCHVSENSLPARLRGPLARR